MSVRSFLRSRFTAHRDDAPATATGDAPISVTEVGPEEFRACLHEAMTIWARAMSYPASLVGPRTVLATAHLDQPKLRVLLARDASQNTLVGFVYGYQSVRGQWWHDEVNRLAEACGATELQRDWLPDCYELCELHVAPEAQGRGIGRRLLEDFLAVAPAARVVLSTPQSPTPAVNLYESTGFELLGSQFTFTGDARPFAIYGRTLSTS